MDEMLRKVPKQNIARIKETGKEKRWKHNPKYGSGVEDGGEEVNFEFQSKVAVSQRIYDEAARFLSKEIIHNKKKTRIESKS